MLKLRTKLLLFALAVFGIGIGVLSGLADGAYSAICLFVMPFLVGLAGASIIADFNSPSAVETIDEARDEPDVAETPATLDMPAAAAWTKTGLQEATREWTN